MSLQGLRGSHEFERHSYSARTAKGVGAGIPCSDGVSGECAGDAAGGGKGWGIHMCSVFMLLAQFLIIVKCFPVNFFKEFHSVICHLQCGQTEGKRGFDHGLYGQSPAFTMWWLNWYQGQMVKCQFTWKPLYGGRHLWNSDLREMYADPSIDSMWRCCPCNWSSRWIISYVYQCQLRYSVYKVVGVYPYVKAWHS